MEQRKAVAEKRAFEIGAMEGKHMVSDIKQMKEKYKTVEYAHTNKNNVYYAKEDAIICEKIEKLKIILLDETIDYAPKRIGNYSKKANIQIAEDSIVMFSSYLRKLTLECNRHIPDSKGTEMLDMYNKLLKESSEKIISKYPKGIKAYYDRLLFKHKSIINTWAGEEGKRVFTTYKKELLKDLEFVADKFIDNLYDTIGSRKKRVLKKLLTEIHKDKYDLKKKMNEKDLNKFVAVNLSRSFYKGVFSKYNKASIKDIYLFHFSSAPYFDENGVLDEERIPMLEAEESLKKAQNL